MPDNRADFTLQVTIRAPFELWQPAQWCPTDPTPNALRNPPSSNSKRIIFHSTPLPRFYPSLLLFCFIRLATSARKPLADESLATPPPAIDQGFVNLTIEESGLSFTFVGLKHNGLSHNFWPVSVVSTFLRVNNQVHDAVGTGSTASISSLGVTLTRTATRLTANYFRLDYSIANGNLIGVEVDVSVALESSSLDLTCAPFGAAQGVVLYSDLSLGLTIAIILNKTVGATPASGGA
jgi:hypothetical protein